MNLTSYSIVFQTGSISVLLYWQGLLTKASPGDFLGDSIGFRENLTFIVIGNHQLDKENQNFD